jgi:hypothetical protein
MNSLNKLLSNASAPLSRQAPSTNHVVCGFAGKLVDELFQMLHLRNGFYVFESALHVFPSNSNNQEIGLNDWNDGILWRDAYGDFCHGCLFFAEDIFGGQFCIKDEKIYTFNPETGSLDYLVKNIEEWSKIILDDYNVLTGYQIAHQWQERHGSLPSRKRLLPKMPFIAGGSFALDNLYLADAVEGMRFRAYLANEIKSLPDGAQIKFKIIE